MESAKDVEIARKAMELTNTWELAQRSVQELVVANGNVSSSPVH